MNIELDAEAIKQIAIQRFHDMYFESVYDCWAHALGIWLKERGYEIVKVADEAGEASDTRRPKN